MTALLLWARRNQRDPAELIDARTEIETLASKWRSNL